MTSDHRRASVLLSVSADLPQLFRCFRHIFGDSQPMMVILHFHGELMVGRYAISHATSTRYASQAVTAAGHNAEMPISPLTMPPSFAARARLPYSFDTTAREFMPRCVACKRFRDAAAYQGELVGIVDVTGQTFLAPTMGTTRKQCRRLVDD